MAPKMERALEEVLLVRLIHSMARQTESQKGKMTKSKSVAKQGHKVWTVVWEPNFLKNTPGDFHAKEDLWAIVLASLEGLF